MTSCTSEIATDIEAVTVQSQSNQEDPQEKSFAVSTFGSWPMGIVTETKQTIPYLASDEALAALDYKGHGELSIGMVRNAAHKIVHLKRVIGLLVVLVFFLLIGMFAASFMAIEMSKEMHVEKGLMVDLSHHPIATIQKVESVSGVQTKAYRRLSNSSNFSTGQESQSNSTNQTGEDDSALFIDSATFFSTVAEYMNGKSAWVVPLPDGTVRTISIQGSSAKSAWGLCGVCHANLVWSVSCQTENTTDMCPIDWQMTGSTLATSDSTTGSSRLLRGSEGKLGNTLMEARALQRDPLDSFDRSLSGKTCI